MKHYGLLGRNIEYSLSPLVHSRLFALSGIDADYTIVDAKSLTPEVMARLSALDGYNVTVPYKREMRAYVQKSAPIVIKTGAVNTVYCSDGKVYGANTDGVGFLRAVGAEFNSGNVLILGTGGAAISIALALLTVGSRVTAAARDTTSDSAQHMQSVFAGRNNFKLCSIDEITGHFTMLVNATPVGTSPAVWCAPVNESVVSCADRVVDLVYSPPQTMLLRMAERAGKPTMNGVAMLVYQAAEAHRVWYGGGFAEYKLQEIIAEVEGKLIGKRYGKNIALVGFMASGKSTMARKLAQLMHADYVDTDEISERRYGAIPKQFLVDGETTFRHRETAILREVASLPGIVIATGGGVLEDEENIRVLHENCIVVWMNTPVDTAIQNALSANLPRPLARSMPQMKKLYEQRFPTYRQNADIVVEAGENEHDLYEKLQRFFEGE